MIPDLMGAVAGLRLRMRRLMFGLALGIFTLSPAIALEFPAAEQAQAWLLTYGPGDLYWQRFGHNSIWIRNVEHGIDHSFNFGYFDFDQPGFIRRFMQGRMLYFGAAFDPVVEMQQYRDEGRTIRAQRLQLTGAQVHRLENYLVNEVQPENRDYLYDYFYANCSTRLRDALDLALDGALSEYASAQPAKLNIREQVNRHSWPDSWLFLGLQTGLGSPIDGPATRWDEAFIPGELADIIAEYKLADGSTMVTESLFEGTQSGAALPGYEKVWTRYLAWGAVLAAVLFIPYLRASKKGWPAHRFLPLAVAWPIIAGTGGCFLLYLWLATNHAAAAQNWNLLVLNPLLLPLSIWLLITKAGAAPTALTTVMIAGWIAGIAAWILPGVQDNSSVLALSLPLTGITAWMLAGQINGVRLTF